MKKFVPLVLFLSALLPLASAPPKTAVVIETTDGILLHAEYVSENDQNGVVDVREAIMPPNLCEEKDFPKYIPKGKFKSPSKLASGHCVYVGKPFIVRSMPLTPAEIKKRYDTTLLTLSLAGEKKQLPFFGTKSGKAWGFNFIMEQQSGVGPAPGLGVQAFPMDKTMDTIQTVDLSGARDTLYPGQGIWASWLKLDPRIGAMYTPLMPTAAISLLNFGVVGFTVENSIAIPEMKFLPLKKYSLRLRGGINAGFHSFSQDLIQNAEAVSTGSITLIPVLFQLTLFWDLKPKNMKVTFSPYFRVADGLVFSSVSTQLKPQYEALLATSTSEKSRSGSYIGNGFQAALGLEIRPNKWPVAFVLDAGYFMHAQDITGSYLVFNAGAAWHYGGATNEPKMLPIAYLGAKSVLLNLRGTVKTPDGKSLAGATIKLYAKGSTNVVKEVQTGDSGKYGIDLEPGLDYKVEARKEAYVKSSVEILLISNDKKTREQDFILAELTYSLDGVNFKPDSDQLVNKAAEKAILELVKFLQANQEIHIELGGHTAASGADNDSSRSLSKKRAETVLKFIVSKGIAADRLTAEGYGGSKPIADGKTSDGAKKNRRVEVRVLAE